MRKELSDALVVFGIVLMEMALVFDWVSGTSGGATYENSPLFVIVLLANLLLAHVPLNVTNALSFASSIFSVMAYLSGMVLAIVSWWRRWVSLIAGGLVVTTVAIWLALFLSLTPVMDIRIDSGLYLGTVSGILLIGAYIYGRPVPSGSDEVKDTAA